MNPVRSFFILLTGFFSAFSFAATTADDIFSEVSAYAANHVAELQQRFGAEARIDFEVSAIDNRLSFPDCPEPLSTSSKNSGNHRVNVKVGCQKGRPWSLYVPVDIQIYRPVVVSTQPIARGMSIQADHLQLKEVSVSQLRGSYFSDINTVIGMEAKRTINPETAIVTEHLNPPMVIKKGDDVLVLASTSTLTVKMPGVALSDGRQGEQIPVQNKQSKRTVKARVIGPGHVQVLM